MQKGYTGFTPIMEQNPSSIKRYVFVIFSAGTILLSFGITYLPIPADGMPFLIVLVPAALALVLAGVTGGRQSVVTLFKKLFQWRVGFKWVAIAIGLGLLLRLLISILGFLLGWIPSIEIRAWSVPQFVILGVILLVAAFLEELGWRGFALPELMRSRSALFSALLIGVLWGCVHLALALPGMVYAGTPWLATILELVGLSVLITWLYVQTGGNLIIAILFHASQSFFVIINEGLSLDQQLWLMAMVYLGTSLVVAILFGINLKRQSATVSDTRVMY